MRLDDINREFWELSKALKDAQIAFAAGNFVQAEPLYVQALSLCERIYGDDHEDTWTCLQNLSDTYYALKKYKESLPILRRLLIARQKVAATTPEVVSVLFKLAKTYEKMGQVTESEAFYRCAVRMGEQACGVESTIVATILESFIVMLRRAQIRLKEADRLEERVRDLRAKIAAGSVRDASQLLGRLADTISPGGGMNAQEIFPASSIQSLDLQPPSTPGKDRRAEQSTTTWPGHDQEQQSQSQSMPQSQSQSQPMPQYQSQQMQQFQMQRNNGRLENLRFSETSQRPPLNSSQFMMVILGLVLMVFLGFCVYGLMTMKSPFESDKTAASNATPDGTPKTAKTMLKAGSTPIYTSPDGIKQVTIFDEEHALISRRGASAKATYTENPPYITVMPENKPNSITFEKTADSLIDPDQTVLYSSEAPENAVINEMKALAQHANLYYRKHGHYPLKAENLMEVYPVVSYTNPFTKEPVWPVKRLLLNFDDAAQEPNSSDVINLQAAAKQLRIWRADETLQPGTVEFFRLPPGQMSETMVILGADKTGHLFHSSKAGYVYIIVCTQGTLREY